MTSRSEHISELSRIGAQVRSEVLGPEFEAQRAGTGTQFNQPFREFSLAFCWAGVWGREGLPLKTRSLLNMAFLIALNRPGELEIHAKGALRNGASVQELQEVLLQAAAYVGIPAAGDAFRVVQAAVDSAESLAKSARAEGFGESAESAQE